LTDDPLLLQVMVWPEELVSSLSVPVHVWPPTWTYEPVSLVLQQSERFQTLTVEMYLVEPSSTFHQLPAVLLV
jgi:hypothetical protein